MVGSSRRVMQIQNVRVQSWILIKTLIFSFGVLVVLFLLTQGYAYAHEDESGATTTTEETVHVDTTGDDNIAIIPASYNYIVQPCGNMSVLVRRSVTLYDEGNDSIELTQAQVLFVETNVVQQMGPRLLDINENFEVSTSLMENYIAQAPGLSAAAINAWDGYASTANFALDDITPTNVPLNDDGSLDTEYNPAPAQENEAPDTDSSSSTPVYWWLIGLGAVILITVMMTPKRHDNN